jgi:hypothetical protein
MATYKRAGGVARTNANVINNELNYSFTFLVRETHPTKHLNLLSTHNK